LITVDVTLALLTHHEVSTEDKVKGDMASIFISYPYHLKNRAGVRKGPFLGPQLKHFDWWLSNTVLVPLFKVLLTPVQSALSRLKLTAARAKIPAKAGFNMTNRIRLEAKLLLSGC
jgi:hypothetical protein